MITINNYFEEIERIGIDNLSETLKKGHEFVLTTTGNNSEWGRYNSNEMVKKVIDFYLTKLNEFDQISKNKKTGRTQIPKKKSNAEGEPTIEKESVFKTAFELLTKFMPGLLRHLKLGTKSGTLKIGNHQSNREIEFTVVDKHSLDSSYRIILSYQVDEQPALQYDVDIYPSKAEAYVTYEWLDHYYQDRFDRDETEEEIESRDGQVDEVLTSSLVQWLGELLKDNLHFNLAINRKNVKSTTKGKKKNNGSQIRKSKHQDEVINVNSKRVEHIREEIKFIKRFVGLHNKTKSPNAILSFIKALQRSIVQKLIRKTSPLAKDIEMIQDKLVTAYNKMKGDENFEINEKDLAKFVAIAGGEEVYPSVKFIRRFIGMQEKELTPKEIESFVNQLQNAVDQKKIKRDDPYADKLEAIHKKLQTTSGKISLTKAELNGLEGIVKACGCKPNLGKIYDSDGCVRRKCKKGTFTDSIRKKGACSHNHGLSGVLSAEQMANRKFEMLNFIDPWKSLVGTPAKNFTMMLHGEPNAGKTTLLLKFAKYLADTFGKALYVSSEEYAASTMTTKIKELLNPIPANLFFNPNLNDIDLSQYDFVILDSVNDLGLKLLDFKALRKDHPGIAFILILQHTKDGQYRGGKDWEHEVEIAGEVENGILTIYRNRYGVKGTMDFFNQSNDFVATPRPYPLNNTIM